MTGPMTMEGHFGGKVMAGKYLGSLLVERGFLRADEVEAVLARQRETGRPFGEMAVAMYNLRMVDVWRAIASQKVEGLARVDLEAEEARATKEALDLVPGRLAWASRVLPLRMEGEKLVCATTARHLADAMAVLHERLDVPIEFVVAEELALKRGITASYS